jgi:hypothetical protein
MTTLVTVFLAAWAAGYVVGYQVFMIRQGFNAST